MKKGFSNIRNKFSKAVNRVQSFFSNIGSKAADKLSRIAFRTHAVVSGTAGEGYVDTGVKIIIGVVILAGLYALFNTTIIPTLTTKSSITQVDAYTSQGDGQPSPSF